MGFLSVIFTIIIAFYLLGLLARVLLRWFLYRKQKEFEKGGYSSFGAGGNARAQGRERRKEGEVSVQRVAKPRTKKVSGEIGDYVEFEEVIEVTDEHRKQA